MPGDRVGDLVAEDGGQPGVVAGDGQDPRVDVASAILGPTRRTCSSAAGSRESLAFWRIWR
ncbi:MAG: hypothetical protein A2050_00815 [Candidatus Rokubacteria bacterium GWA2_73_35]|nr:MAG: hypothetical protein A2050_00815 [Candidatus Rokubacteria bacterium GWA2_73_35]